MAGVAGDLMICRLSQSYGSVLGGDELFVLCSSVRKGAFICILLCSRTGRPHYRFCLSVCLSVMYGVLV